MHCCNLIDKNLMLHGTILSDQEAGFIIHLNQCNVVGFKILAEKFRFLKPRSKRLLVKTKFQVNYCKLLVLSSPINFNKYWKGFEITLIADITDWTTLECWVCKACEVPEHFPSHSHHRYLLHSVWRLDNYKNSPSSPISPSISC